MRTIGKYEVVEKIGDGGFGTVFKGFDPHIKRFVAIKSCTSEEQEVRNRFFHEAQIAGNLQHRNIVTVYDFGLQDEVPYLVQEYLSGEDLDRKIKRKDAIPLPDKLVYMMQVARGLEYAHTKGVTHRDIKPANIRILEDGTAKIMDFGIAKIADQDTGLTQTGMTLGTAAYLAPEQIRGEPVGPATDIFSWGVSAWELLCYQRPFVGQHISTVLYQILNEPPPSLRQLVPEVPAEIVAIVERCLEKKPERRYQRCTEILRDLETAIQGKRLFAQSGLATLVAASRTEAADTRAIPTPAAGALRAPDAASTAPVAMTRATVQGEVGELELDSIGAGRTPHSISATQALRSRGLGWTVWATAAALVVLGVGIGWLVAHRRPPAPPSEPVTRSAQRTVIPAGPAGGAGGIALASTGTGASIGGSAVRPGAPPVASTAPSVAPAPSAPPQPTPVAPAKPSYVVIPAAWSADVSVAVDKQRHALGSEQRIRVEPGPVTLRFSIAEPYAKTVERTVKVAAGQTLRVDVPIEKPADIQVQQKIGTPLGRVTLDGTEIGSGIVRRAIEPGTHALRIDPVTPGAQPIEKSIEVPAGSRLVVTFDLASGSMTPVVRSGG